jgi:hypothetical protein
MTFVQRIRPSGDGRCGEFHGDCAVIDCITTEPVTHHETGEVIHEAGSVVWHSHMHSAIHPEHRLNGSHPAEDHRSGRPVPVIATDWCDECRGHPAVAAILS